jgi:iron complex outermembrane receptor protein
LRYAFQKNTPQNPNPQRVVFNSLYRATRLQNCLLIFFSALIYFTPSTSLYAQQELLKAQNPDTAVIDEIVVTSKRRMEMAQDLAMAATVFNSDALELMKIENLNSLSLFSPGLYISNYNKSTPQLFMRGIGSNTSGASDSSSVALFVDDVYLARPGFFDADIFTVDSVEVLRGPQGTLYGKNVVGGAIRISHQSPTDIPSAKISLTLGSLNRQDLQLYANTALDESFAANIALSQRQRDGYVENTVNTVMERNENSLAWRTQLQFIHKPKLEIRLAIDGATQDIDGNGRGLAGEALAINGVAIGSAPSLNIYGKTDTPVAGFTQSNDKGIAVHINYESSYFDWTSITAYRNSDYQFRDEIFPSKEISVLVNSADESASQFSQEFRLANIDDDNYAYIAGLYFLQEKVDRKEEFDLSGVAYWFGFPADFAKTAKSHFDATNKTDSFALFTEWDITLSNRLSFNLGGRYTLEQKTFSSRAFGNDLGFGILISPYQVDDEQQTWKDFSPRSGLKYTIDQYQMAYLSYSQGFKSGAFNSLASNLYDARHAVNPEQAGQWELGYKSFWLEQRLMANALIFSIDYDDLQVFQTNNGVTSVENAASARSQGIEVELLARPFHALELSAFYAYLDARYDEYNDGKADYSGNDLLRAPRNSYSTSVSYTAQLSNALRAIFRVDYTFKDKLYFLASNEESSRAGSFALVNARVQLEGTDDSWSVALWGKNILNEEYQVFITQAFSTQSVIPGEPRVFGLTLSYYH